MNIHFHTNLDLAKHEVGNLDRYTVLFPTPPSIGSRIELNKGDPNKVYQLEVIGVTYDIARNKVLVELHMPSYYHQMSIDQWEKWFKHHMLGQEW